MNPIKFLLCGIFSACLLMGVPLAQGAEPVVPGEDRAESTQEALDEARELFLEAIDALNRAGKKAYEEKAPEVKKKARDVFEESRKLLEQWMDQVEQEMEGRDQNSKEAPAEPESPKSLDRSYI
ncbi:MAG: hypothetical protein HQL84_14135 [Magnetococcales bacterium]|nr:hypothetical protein [Magnetococcales bacterium]MBF0151176.1 hypothetical protein [Magnetococcales bacterium]MBF0174624.1 hypothetical protein [Magnetococcales bacterium]MBF0348682.1 hypothetical protein [Magnetococcales bacterium]MBF0632658.1 hypothetical protein [Magnetococcales bacterium]